jgi:glycosyltransferase involved in cell wall biosynthesis
MKYTFHVVGLPHTQTNRAYCSCAYTSKVYKFCKMMYERGHTVYHYGAAGSDPLCTESVGVFSASRQAELCPREYYKVEWDSTLSYWAEFNAAATIEIRNRANRKDFLCLIGGMAQQPIARSLPLMMAVEYGIGYEGTFSRYRCFESYSHLHTVWAKQGIIDGRFYNVVIPNYFDSEDFPAQTTKGAYLLYLGRIIQRKGIHIACQVAKACGKRLIIAGPGAKSYKDDTLIGEDGGVYDGVDYVGEVNVEQRAVLMGQALAVLVPTIYIEPFGGVAVEAQLAGTPAITTDWGAFPETVIQGVTGFRCRTLGQFVEAVRLAPTLNREVIRSSALRRYSLESVAPMYEAYFSMLHDLWEDGWNSLDNKTFVPPTTLQGNYLLSS